MRKAGYSDFVFINCPFDNDYLPLLRALVYTVYYCGFIPKTALDEDNAMDNRLTKIIGKIKDCCYGVHDLSRVELNHAGLPRFNMPFELGIFFGAKYLGTGRQRAKNALIFERKKYSYQQYISDLNGIDTKAHRNNPAIAMQALRDWLRTASGRQGIAGYALIQEDYRVFLKELPGIAKLIGFTVDNLPFTDYCTIVEEYVARSQAL